MIAVALVWVAFAWVVVPVVIESAYRGENLPFLNAFISGQAIHPVEYYLSVWEDISWRVFGVLLVLGLIPLPLVGTGPAVQNYLETRYSNASTLIPAVTNTILAVVGFMLVFYLYYLHPVGYVYLISEDYWGEYASFVSWAMASCFLAWLLFKNPGFRKPGFVLLALGTFFVAMEEISWGQRIVGLSSPTWFAKYNLQGETNLHNLGGFPEYSLLGFALLVWSILLALLARKWRRLRQWCDKFGIPIVHIHLWPLFLLAILYLIYQPMIRYDEMAELFLGFAMAALSLDLVLTMRRGAKVEGIQATAAAAGMMVTLGILTAFLVQFYSWPEGLKYELHSFAATRFPNVGMYRQSEMVFDYIDQQPQFLISETRFHRGLLLMQRGQHKKAREILELSLAEQRQVQQKWPERPIPYRIAGQVLALLGQREEAQAAFLEAIQKDEARLERVKDASDEARIRWSLGETFLAMGNFVAAAEQLSMARALADPSTRFLIDQWIQRTEALAAR
ncbi:MAG: tetratricopeptide repeat protein [Candidatus Methylomirabilales bacterium]